MKTSINIKQKLANHPKMNEIVFLIILFAISIFIRRIGLKHGFPILTHADESAVIQPVLDMTRLHTLNPGNFNRPNQILYYLNFVYLNLVSFISYGKNVYWAFDEHYLNFYFHSRLLISIFGSFIPIVVYKIGKEISVKFAIISAIVFSLFPIYTEHSLYITPDIPITLFSLIVIYFAFRFINTNQEKYIILATIFSAINTAEKYPGLLSLIIVFAAVGIQMVGNTEDNPKFIFRKFLLRSIKIVLIFIIALFIVAPFLFIEYQSVFDALISESRSTHLGADNLGWLGNMWFYIKTFYTNINIIGVLLFCIGLFSLMKTWNKKYFLLLYGVFYWIALSKLGLHWERWALPMFISPLFIISSGISYLWEKEKQNPTTKPISVLIVIIFIIQQGIHTVYIPIRLKFTETRLVSNYYCEMIGITEENSIFEGYTPLAPSTPKEIFSDYLAVTANKEYILLSSSMYRRIFAEPDRYQEYIRIYNEIRNNNQIIKQFQPFPIASNTISQMENILYFLRYRLGLTDEIRYSGPTIEIYKITQ